MANDIQRHLNREPVEARPPTPLRNLSTWCRRHTKLAAGAVLLVTALALSITAWQAGRVALKAAVAAEVEADFTRAYAAASEGDLALATSLLDGCQNTLDRLANDELAIKGTVEQLAAEIDRYKKFVVAYDTARRRRSKNAEEFERVQKALTLYDYPFPQKWTPKDVAPNAPGELQDDIKEKIFELLVLVSYDRMFYLDELSVTIQQKLATLGKARQHLADAIRLHHPTKGYFWVLATYHQRMGDFTEGEVRDHHDAEALRLRVVAAETKPLNAAELFYICRDRRYGCAASDARKPFRNPYKDFDEELAAYREMLDLEPKYYNAHFFTALRLANNSRYAEALHAWNGCLALNPNDVVARSNKAEVLVWLGLIDEGLSEQRKAIQTARKRADKKPESTMARGALIALLSTHGKSLQRIGRQTDAEATVREALIRAQDLGEDFPESWSAQNHVKETEELLKALPQLERIVFESRDESAHPEAATSNDDIPD